MPTWPREPMKLKGAVRMLQGFDPAVPFASKAKGRCLDERASALHRGLGLPNPSRKNQHSNPSYPDNFDS